MKIIAVIPTLNETSLELNIKRMFDVTLSLVALVLSSPLWLIITIFILIEDGKPILYKQYRCGKGLRRFYLIKFRTMKNGKHQIVNYVVDHRVTKVGKILRGIGIDSLPELINILRGDMSFVGPRPMPYAIEDEKRYKNIEQVPGHYLRGLVVPGLTGLAQIYGTKFMTRHSKFRFDCLYVEKQSLFLDFKLILVSIWITLFGKWEKKPVWIS